MRIFILAALLGLSACATTQDGPRPAPSIVFATDQKRAKEKVAARLISDGWALTQSNDLMLVAERHYMRPDINVILYTCGYCAQPLQQLTMTFLPEGKSTRVVANAMLVINPRSNLERRVTSSPEMNRIALELLTVASITTD